MNTKDLLSELIDIIRIKYTPEEKVKTSKDGIETVFFRKAGKALCYIEKTDKPQVVITFGKTLNEKVMRENLRENIKEMYMKAKEFYDGKWLFIHLETREDLDDIIQLLSIKRQPNRS